MLEKNRLYVGAETLKGVGIRSAVATALRSLLGKKYKTVKIATYLSHPKCTASLRAAVEGVVLGAYTFTTYKSKKIKSRIKNIQISTEGYGDNYEVSLEAMARAVHNGDIAGSATNFTRDIVNTTPDDCYPEIMANIAEDLAKNSSLKCKILKPKELRKEKMETLLAVARASRHKPRVIHLAHKPKDPVAVISLVGKGLTYDSGGLSLKPADYMVGMKSDKSGGSCLLYTSPSPRDS